MKKKVIITLVIILLILSIPIPVSRNDGGTIEYCAVLYKVISWNQFNSVRGEQNYRGINIYFFPSNFRIVDWENR